MLVQSLPSESMIPPNEWNLAKGDGIPVELFKILKDDVVKVLHSVLSLSLSFCFWWALLKYGLKNFFFFT